MTGFDPQFRLGRALGWRMSFHAAVGDGVGGELLSVDNTGHFADISVTLEGGLTPGQLDIKLWRMRDADFETLVLARTSPGAPGDNQRVALRAGLFVKLQLFWRDKVGDEPGKAAAPVVETFRITRLHRQSEGLEMQTLIEGRRALFERLSNAKLPVGAALPATDPLNGATVLLLACGFVADNDFVVHAPLGAPPPSPPISLVPGQPVLAALASLKTQMLQRPPYRRGRPIYLIRDNVLHVGPYRPIPHDASAGVIALDRMQVIIRAEETGEVLALEAAETAIGDVPEPRLGYQLTCSGVGHLYPGDVVSFTPDPAKSGLLGGFGLPAVPGGLGGANPDEMQLYVSSVSHRISRTTGWQTVIAGVTVSGMPLSDTAWDVVRTREAATTDEAGRGPASDAGAGLRQGVGARINAAFAARPVSIVAEVREHVFKTVMGSGNVEKAAHSTRILRGIDDQGGPNQARLDEIDRETGDTLDNVPYLTPFAWGPYGQVLPRYPGTRVMLLNHRRDGNDPVDIGALWRTSDAEPSSAPGAAQLGDWWLILPAFPGNPPPALADGKATVSLPEKARASHDLIDAAGARVMHVNGFTIRSFEADKLPAPTDRPAVASDDAEKSGILIEHASKGSRIRMLKDGTIEIEAAGDLKLKGNNIKLIARGSGTVDASNE